MIEYALATQQEKENDKNNKKRIRVVEFCAGSGFVLLPLAQLYPHVDFVLIDYKTKSIQIARERVSSASLEDNVQVIEGRIQDYHEAFDVGIALHACGTLSDIVLDMCLSRKASFVVCPCCIGKISFKRCDALLPFLLLSFGVRGERTLDESITMKMLTSNFNLKTHRIHSLQSPQ